jgi:hypothetical protein
VRSETGAAELAGVSSDEVNRLLDQELTSLGDLLPDPKKAPDVKKRG